ncbi:hypothetical protein CAT7_04829 [Carnobacterium sp. AT7]|uniref:hypothetical protein n=1 Tax=Carnobacterium sp. AT7 TaxID=333990 RepID=UPI00015F1A1B|nr:hypothetical protein [Carnobacterium sp. AT7]EDP68562.1 hypothetical protein CAT7_04829 [Carnobacterium sp. AT7]
MSVYGDGKEIIKDVMKLANGISDMELRGKILDLHNQFYELIDENRELREELHKYKNIQILENNLKYRNGVYTKDKEVYCGVCWDRDKNLCRVRKVGEKPENETTTFVCDVCNKWRFSDIPFVED